MACWESCFKDLKREQKINDEDTLVAEAMENIDSEIAELLESEILVAV